MGDDQTSKAMGQALRYLGFRARSEAEMRQYLQDKEYGEDVIDQILERLRDYKYLDDDQFARGVVSAQSGYRRKGSRVVEQKLYQSGVDKESAQSALGEIDGEKELENARYWVNKIAPALERDELQKRRQKMYRRLSNKGFSYDIIREACRGWEEGETFD